MAKYKRYDYSQSVLIPVCLPEQLVPGTLEFAIHTLVESRMDMSVFDSNYQNDETGRSAYDPKILLKVVLLAYSRGLTSSRPIERACCENVLFMAISCNQRPDHSTIASFVSSMKDQIKPLFRDILLVCDQEGLLGAYSGRFRPAIPDEAGHPFRLIPAPDSGRSRPPIPEQAGHPIN